MSISDLSFNLYTDSGLSVAYSGISNLLHNTDQSDNPQDFTFWLGSNLSGRILQALSDPGVDQITLTPTDILPEWEDTTAYSLGQCVEPTTPNGLRYEATTAGTSHATTEPTWPTTPVGATVTDGTVTWTLRGASHQTTEVKLALTEIGLDTAIAGAALNLGTTIESTPAEAVEFWMRVTNAVTIVSDNSSTPEIAININYVKETIV